MTLARLICDAVGIALPCNVQQRAYRRQWRVRDAPRRVHTATPYDALCHSNDRGIRRGPPLLGVGDVQIIDDRRPGRGEA
jgi:hypothetical protein